MGQQWPWVSNKFVTIPLKFVLTRSPSDLYCGQEKQYNWKEKRKRILHTLTLIHATFDNFWSFQFLEQNTLFCFSVCVCVCEVDPFIVGMTKGREIHLSPNSITLFPPLNFTSLPLFPSLLPKFSLKCLQWSTQTNHIIRFMAIQPTAKEKGRDVPCSRNIQISGMNGSQLD